MAGHLLGLWYDPFEHVFDYWGDARETADQPGRYDTGDLQGPQDVVEYWAAKWVACLARKDPDASRRGPWRHPTTRSERAASSRRLFGMVAFRDSGRNARRRWSPLREWEKSEARRPRRPRPSGTAFRQRVRELLGSGRLTRAELEELRRATPESELADELLDA